MCKYYQQNGACILTEAIEYRRIELIKYILSCKVKLKNIGVGTLIGTPAHYCIKNMFLDSFFFEKMLKKGLSPNSVDSYGRTCVHLCFTNFSRDSLRFHKISDLFMMNGCNPNLKDYEGMTSIIIAAKKSDKVAIRYASEWNERCRKLIRKNELMFDFNIMHCANDFTCAHYACNAPSLNMINDICGDRMTNPFSLDKNLRTPSYYVPAQYLTSKKMILKYERKRLGQFFKDPDSFPISMTSTTNYSRCNYSDSISETLGQHDTSEVRLDKFRTSTKMFKNKFRKVDKLDLSKISRESSNSFMMEKLEAPITIPNSAIERNCRNSMKMKQGRNRGFNPFLKRGGGIGMESKYDQKVIILNNKLVRELDKVEKLFEKLEFAFNHKDLCSNEILFLIQKLKRMIFSLITILNFYRKLTGISINFAKGTNIYNSLQTIVKRFENRIHNMSGLLTTDLEMMAIWQSFFASYMLYIEQLSETASFKKEAFESSKRILELLKDHFKLMIVVRDPLTQIALETGKN